MPIRDAVEAEALALKQCLGLGRVAGDVPIDLQNLLVPDQAVAIWELTRRPIDKKLNAMPPLADRIGAPVARFSAIMRAGDFHDRLGEDLFETYPAENLRRLEFSGNYKARGSEGLSERRPALENLCRLLTFDGVAALTMIWMLSFAHLPLARLKTLWFPRMNWVSTKINFRMDSVS
jgi:hypothetical protein